MTNAGIVGDEYTGSQTGWTSYNDQNCPRKKLYAIENSDFLINNVCFSTLNLLDLVLLVRLS
ncbi:MAG: hypothetical protein COA78_03885 [Blastopirellula sp.]|nr:MAG: hypothetical protein COA78_03885 [Blastopirellula sp.]